MTMSFWNKNKNRSLTNSLLNNYNNQNDDDNYLLKGGIQQNDYLDNLSFANNNTNDNSNSPTLSQGFGLMSKFGIGNAGSSGGGTPWGAIASGAKTGYNELMGKDESDYNDVEQTIAYPMQGAAIGSQFGPWGTAAGALYGLGYSLKDNIGLDDNDVITDIFFPVGMGDEHQGLIQL